VNICVVHIAPRGWRWC